MTRQFKVGLFVVFGVVLTMVTVFLIGDTRRLWEKKTGYTAAFADVAGLKPGAPIRMGGLDVGSVVALSHGESVSDPRIYVKMSISTNEVDRIRSDSVARVVNKGLLGDKMLEISVGSPGRGALPPGSLIPSEEPEDVLASANKVVETTEQAIERVGAFAATLGDPKLSTDIKASAADVHALLDAVVHGNGAAHRFFFDDQEADRIDSLLTHLDRSASRLDAALGDVQDVTAHVRQGPGIAHALLYDGEMSKDVAGAILEVHTDLKAIREGNGLAHTLLYGDDSSGHVMANVNAMSDDLRVIVSGLRQGKGTLGALLVDPSVYEDLKSAIGNVERNEVLRALVRYSIKADEKRTVPAAKP